MCHPVNDTEEVIEMGKSGVMRKFLAAVGYLGGGIGWLDVPKIGNPDAVERGALSDVVCGVNIRAFWKIGFYIEGKYIYCSKTTDGVKVIDFSDVGAMVGISLNLGW